MKQAWRIIKKIINTKNRTIEYIVKKIIQDDIVHESSGDIANMFNDYFVDIVKNVAVSIGENNNNHHYMTRINQPNSFFLQNNNSLLFH